MECSYQSSTVHTSPKSSKWCSYIHITLITAGFSSSTNNKHKIFVGPNMTSHGGLMKLACELALLKLNRQQVTRRFPALLSRFWNSIFLQFHGGLMIGPLCVASWCPLMQHNLATNLKHKKGDWRAFCWVELMHSWARLFYFPLTEIRLIVNQTKWLTWTHSERFRGISINMQDSSERDGFNGIQLYYLPRKYH